MALIGIAVETHVFRQEVLKRPEKAVVPVIELENGPEHPLKAAIFVARNTQSARDSLSSLRIFAR